MGNSSPTCSTSPYSPMSQSTSTAMSTSPTNANPTPTPMSITNSLKRKEHPDDSEDDKEQETAIVVVVDVNGNDEDEDDADADADPASASASSSAPASPPGGEGPSADSAPAEPGIVPAAGPAAAIQPVQPPRPDEYEAGRVICETCGTGVSFRDEHTGGFTVHHWEAHRLTCPASISTAGAATSAGAGVGAHGHPLSAHAHPHGHQVRPFQRLPHASSSLLSSLSPTHLTHPSSLTHPPSKRRRAKRTEDERIAYLRADPYVAQFEAYRVLCASCDKWIRLRPNSTYCSIPWDAHRKSCLAKKISSKNIYALEERNTLFSKDPDVRKFDPERLLCNMCDKWLAVSCDDHMRAVRTWLEHRAGCGRGTGGSQGGGFQHVEPHPASPSASTSAPEPSASSSNANTNANIEGRPHLSETQDRDRRERRRAQSFSATTATALLPPFSETTSPTSPAQSAAPSSLAQPTSNPTQHKMRGHLHMHGPVFRALDREREREAHKPERALERERNETHDRERMQPRPPPPTTTRDPREREQHRPQSRPHGPGPQSPRDTSIAIDPQLQRAGVSPKAEHVQSHSQAGLTHAQGGLEGGKGQDPFPLTTTLTPATYPPAQSLAHESRRRNAEQRAATLRADRLIGEVQPNRVFCSLCMKWVQLRQDSSYCAYPWIQHRGKCVRRYQRRTQKAAELADGKGRRPSHPHASSSSANHAGYPYYPEDADARYPGMDLEMSMELGMGLGTDDEDDEDDQEVEQDELMSDRDVDMQDAEGDGEGESIEDKSRDAEGEGDTEGDAEGEVDGEGEGEEGNGDLESEEGVERENGDNSSKETSKEKKRSKAGVHVKPAATNASSKGKKAVVRTGAPVRGTRANEHYSARYPYAREQHYSQHPQDTPAYHPHHHPYANAQHQRQQHYAQQPLQHGSQSRLYTNGRPSSSSSLHAHMQGQGRYVSAVGASSSHRSSGSGAPPPHPSDPGGNTNTNGTRTCAWDEDTHPDGEGELELQMGLGVGSAMADLESPSGRKHFIHLSITHLFRTSFRPSDDLTISALLAYLNAAIPQDKYEDFDTAEVARAVGGMRERGRVWFEGDVVRCV